jgi:hypothetical protein
MVSHTINVMRQDTRPPHVKPRVRLREIRITHHVRLHDWTGDITNSYIFRVYSPTWHGFRELRTNPC